MILNISPVSNPIIKYLAIGISFTAMEINRSADKTEAIPKECKAIFGLIFKDKVFIIVAANVRALVLWRYSVLRPAGSSAE